MLDAIFRRISRSLHFDPYGNLFQDRTLARLGKALSPRYAWHKVRAVQYELLHPDHPWMTRDAIAWLDLNLRPYHQGFEWGSGNGTRWFARKTRSIVSVEHNAEWAARVRSQIAAEGLRNVDYRVVEEASYLDTIDPFPDGAFDYVVVDGLFRDEALNRSLPKLKPGGMLVFDNANWYLPSKSRTPHSRSLAEGAASPRFAEAHDKMQDYRVVWTTNGIDDTAIFIKP